MGTLKLETVHDAMVIVGDSESIRTRSQGIQGDYNDGYIGYGDRCVAVGHGDSSYGGYGESE